MLNKQEYQKLVREMIEHDARYYDEAKPLISDYEYDQKMAQLRTFEKKHPEWIDPDSPSQRVAESATEGFEQRSHLTPMYSLENTYSEEDVAEFLKRIHKSVEKAEFCCELKMDGTAISILYENGKLRCATTRGNGKIGDDVTANIKTISSIPFQLKGSHHPEKIEIRGEVYMSLATFRSLNVAREEEGLEPFANPRNAAAGSLKLLDPKETVRRKLQIVTYGFGQEVIGVSTQSQVHEKLHEWGLPTGAKEHLAKACNLSEIMAFASKIQKERSSLPFEIDGIVIKVNSLKTQAQLGHTGKVPRFAIAYKFAPEQACTKIKEITVQVGRSGVLTPVAELEPVFLAGSTISRATLHNEEEVARKDIRVEDSVIIEKGGDVIPKVVSVDVKKRPAHSKPWKMPAKCPICHTPVTRIEGEVAVRCANPRCSGQRLRRIIYFASKHAMDIENLGEKVAEQLVELGLVSQPSDIYLLDEHSLARLEGFKEKSIRNLIESIQESRNCSLSRFIMGLGIRHVGTETAEILADYFGTLDHLLKAKEEDLLQIDGIGEKTAHIIHETLQNSEVLKEIQQLLAHGVKPQKKAVKKIEGHPFAGKSFVLTGTLPTYSREEATQLIKERGGKVSGSISKETDFLLLGADPGSKYDKAKKIGTRILEEKDFKNLL